jgi:hypothetical protein
MNLRPAPSGNGAPGERLRYTLSSKTEASLKLQEISDMIWIVKLTFCGEDFWNPFMPDDTIP